MSSKSSRGTMLTGGISTFGLPARCHTLNLKYMTSLLDDSRPPRLPPHDEHCSRTVRLESPQRLPSGCPLSGSPDTMCQRQELAGSGGSQLNCRDRSAMTQVDPEQSSEPPSSGHSESSKRTVSVT